MTENDIHLEFKKDTGDYVPDVEDLIEHTPQATSILGYIHWLEQQIMALSKPVVIYGEAFRTTINKNEP